MVDPNNYDGELNEGDLIISVDQVDTKNMSSDHISQFMRQK